MNAVPGANPNGGRDWAQVRADNGHPVPYGVTHWEVGNEMHGENQRYWIGTGISEAELARRYAEGGTSRFVDQPVGTQFDHRPSASIARGGRSFWVHYPPIKPGTLTVKADDKVVRGYKVDAASGRITFDEGEKPDDGAQVTASYSSGPHDGFIDLYGAMREVDPSIQIGSALTTDEFIARMGSRPYDFLVLHHYTPVPVASNAAELHDAMMLNADSASTEIRHVRSSIATHAGDRVSEVDLVVSEYGVNGRVGEVADHYLLSLDHALHTALQLHEWMRAGVKVAQKHTLTDYLWDQVPDGAFVEGNPDYAVLGGPPGFARTATSAMFSLLTRHTGSVLFEATVSDNPTRSTGQGSLAALEVIASTSDGELHLVVINRDRERAVEAMLPVPGAATSVSVSSLTADSYLSFNSARDPDAISFTTSTVAASDLAAYTFPAHSITGFTFPASN